MPPPSSKLRALKVESSTTAEKLRVKGVGGDGRGGERMGLGRGVHMHGCVCMHVGMQGRMRQQVPACWQRAADRCRSRRRAAAHRRMRVPPSTCPSPSASMPSALVSSACKQPGQQPGQQPQMLGHCWAGAAVCRCHPAVGQQPPWRLLCHDHGLREHLTCVSASRMTFPSAPWASAQAAITNGSLTLLGGGRWGGGQGTAQAGGCRGSVEAASGPSPHTHHHLGAGIRQLLPVGHVAGQVCLQTRCAVGQSALQRRVQLK